VRHRAERGCPQQSGHAGPPRPLRFVPATPWAGPPGTNEPATTHRLGGRNAGQRTGPLLGRGTLRSGERAPPDSDSAPATQRNGPSLPGGGLGPSCGDQTTVWVSTGEVEPLKPELAL
jgi:hypothetical protein